MKTRNLRLVAAVLALAVGVGLLTPSGTAHAQPLVPHYECYDIVGPAPPGLLPTVLLTTQFGEEIVQLQPGPMRLCLPAIKNQEGDLNVPHVECLPIMAGTSPGKTVNLVTQFGTQTNVQVGPAMQMCMPATKAIGGVPPSQPPPPVPHYECYAISGTAPAQTVTIETQFGTHLGVVVGAPTRLCLPALKNGEGSLDPSVPHVECFQISGAPPGGYPPVGLLTQWGPQAGLGVLNPTELCVPALKEVVPPTPTPWPTPFIGGIAEAPDVDASSLGATASGGSSGTTYAVIAGIAAGVVLLGAGGWYARRRWRAS